MRAKLCPWNFESVFFLFISNGRKSGQTPVACLRESKSMHWKKKEKAFFLLLFSALHSIFVWIVRETESDFPLFRGFVTEDIIYSIYTLDIYHTDWLTDSRRRTSSTMKRKNPKMGWKSFHLCNIDYIPHFASDSLQYKSNLPEAHLKVSTTITFHWKTRVTTINGRNSF